MDLMRIEAPDFDLAMTLNSGQVFHWEKYGAGFCGTIGEHAVYVEKRGEVLQIKMEGGALRRHGQHQILQNVPRPTTAATAGSRELAPPSAARVVARYFALDHPLEEICASFPRDQAMNAARDFCRGLRIIRQPKWECLATFICSSMKQVLLRVATMCAEIICSEIRQHLSSYFASPGKIFFAQDSFDPNVNGECCDSLVGEQHDAIRHFHPHARELAQLLPQLSVRERAPRIQIRLPGRDKLRRFQQVSRAIPEPAFS